MATIVLYKHDQTIFAGSVKNKNDFPLLFLSTKREDQAYTDGTAKSHMRTSLILPPAWANTRDELLDEALGPQNIPERSTACQLISQCDFG